jgi:hypothetical protein
MSALFTALQETFSRAGWQCRPVEGEGFEVVEAEFEAHHTKVCLHAQVFADLHTVSVVAEAPLQDSNPSPVLLGRLAELLMRANKELSLGAFEMDWDEAKVLFRLSNIFAPEHYTGEIIGGLVHTTVVEMDRITPCVSIVEKAVPGELERLDLAALLAREDLLPAVGEGSH